MTQNSDSSICGVPICAVPVRWSEADYFRKNVAGPVTGLFNGTVQYYSIAALKILLKFTHVNFKLLKLKLFLVSHERKER